MPSLFPKTTWLAWAVVPLASPHVQISAQPNLGPAQMAGYALTCWACAVAHVAPPTAAQESAAAGPRPDQQPSEQQEFDAFLGNDAGMFAKSAYGEYDKDDEEADAVWNKIDERMDERRREQREKRLAEEIEKYRLENPKITEQFADLKRKLGTMSEVRWLWGGGVGWWGCEEV